MSWLIFGLLGALTLGAGLGVVLTRNVVHAALFLLVSLVAVAGLYLALFAEFLALVQVLIYGGAIVIVLLFAIMLTRTAEYPRISDNRQWPLAAVAALALLGVMAAAFLWSAPTSTVGAGLVPALTQPAPLHPEPVEGPAFADLGNSLFTTWAVPFEIASLVLLVALIGAIIIARSRGDGG